MRAILSLALVLLSAAAAVPAEAQVIAPPPRSSTGLLGGDVPSPGDTQQQLTLQVTALGAYDDNLSADQEGATISPLAARRSGVMGVATSALRYRRFRNENSFEAGGNAFVNSFRNVGVEPLIGGDAEVRVTHHPVSSTSINGTVRGEYRPTFSFVGVAAPGQIDAPATDPTAGVSATSSRGLTGSLGVVQDWNRRQQSTVTGRYSQQRYLTTGFTVESRSVYLAHRVEVNRHSSLQVGYRNSHQEADEADGGVRPLDSHWASIGLEYRFPISRTRMVSLSGGPSANYVQTLSSITEQPFEYVTPSGYASVRMDLGRTWSLAVDFNRQASVLEGLTRQSFMTSSFTLSLGGGLGRRLTFAASGMYSEGAPHEGETGSFLGASATTQLQYAFSDWGALVTSYNYYQHELRDLTNLPEGFPAVSDRSTVRVGVTMQLPLYGSFPRTTTPRRGGRN